MKKFNQTLSLSALLLLSVNPSMANPDETGDGQAHLVNIGANGEIEFLTTPDITYPESGNIEEFEEWVAVNGEDNVSHLDPKRYHMIVEGNHDMLIPLGRFLSGPIKISYGLSSSNHFDAGEILVCHNYDTTGAKANRVHVLEHKGVSSGGKHPVRLRSATNGNGWEREYLLEFDRLWSPDVDGESQLSITVTTNMRRSHSVSSAAQFFSVKSSELKRLIVGIRMLKFC